MSKTISAHGNKRMAFAVLVLIALILFLWYFNHPLSPYNSRTTYIAAFNEVGPLSNGSNVQINGLHRGRILKMDKTDSLIYLHFEIISKIKIPIDSKVKFISAGFLGNREIYIELGTSNKVFSKKDTIKGSYDKGLANTKENVESSLIILSKIKADANAISDSLFKGENRNTMERIKKKGKKLILKTDISLTEWKKETSELFSRFATITEKTETILKKTEQQLDNAKYDLDSLNVQLCSLKESADSLNKKIKETSITFNSNSNSVGATIQDNSIILQKIDKLQVDIDKLVEEIKKNGIKFNVDIF